MTLQSQCEGHRPDGSRPGPEHRLSTFPYSGRPWKHQPAHVLERVLPAPTQEALRAVRAELQEVMSQEGLKLEPDSDLVLSREQLQKLVTLERGEREHAFSTMSMNIRVAQEDFTLKLDLIGHTKGRHHHICPQAIHFDPEIYQDPEVGGSGAVSLYELILRSGDCSCYSLGFPHRLTDRIRAAAAWSGTSVTNLRVKHVLSLGAAQPVVYEICQHQGPINTQTFTWTHRQAMCKQREHYDPGQRPSYDPGQRPSYDPGQRPETQLRSRTETQLRSRTETQLRSRTETQRPSYDPGQRTSYDPGQRPRDPATIQDRDPATIQDRDPETHIKT
ncbi:hypothetical protein WMY93_026224 [Mugilogobius chulae]|uniref:Uncharacterized protein n=1 Tax=Mugilogobius chulae TaxID=88201 RepID=A0AAW0N6V1_9GOBI